MPTFRTGMIFYLEMPAKDVEVSATFYEQAFGWNIRQRHGESPSFDDTLDGVDRLRRPLEVRCGLQVSCVMLPT